MKQFFLYVLLAVSITTSGQNKYLFGKSSFSNIIFLDKVHDTIILVHEDSTGIQYTLLNDQLRLIQTNKLNTNIKSDILSQQLQSSFSSLGIIKQRIVNDKFQVIAKSLSLIGEKNLSTGIQIFEEIYSGNDPTLSRFDIIRSSSGKHQLVYRIQRMSQDSVRVNALFLDSNFTLTQTMVGHLPMNYANEHLYSVDIDDEGNAYFITGEYWEKHVMGTELHLASFHQQTGNIQHRLIKSPKRKLQSLLSHQIVNDHLYLIAPSCESPVAEEIKSLTSISIDLNSYAYKIDNYDFSKQFLRELSLITGGDVRGIMNYCHLLNASFTDTTSSIIGFTFPAIVSKRSVAIGGWYSPHAYPSSGQSSSGFDAWPISASPPSEASISTVKGRMPQSVFMVTNDNARIETSAIIFNRNDAGSRMPIICFDTDMGPKILYHTANGKQISLALSAVTNSKVSTPKLLPNTESIRVVDPIEALVVKGSGIFKFIDAKTGDVGLMLVQ